MSSPSDSPDSAAAPADKQYVVVARRYRPQAFDELVGQEHVGKALSNAISTSRVGHAYLFTGARGVGKTSTARILAKALNCERGTSPNPCNECDTCRSIGTGEDVDVLEIDGASNRGIDEIRQLRQNVNVRPSRSRYKIYIIDEVHMLTREAFNALLKTLEEPPEHVKFIFCTTEASKIPITILSRCQRFDFAGILTSSIAKRLRQIVDAEGVEAEPEALQTIARRASGSMRDSQSLLEQLLSFSPGKIALADVHNMLGTAADETLGSMLEHLLARRPAEALADLDAALDAGVDVAQLLEQLLGYLRDCMVAAAGGSEQALLYSSSATRSKVMETGKRLGLQTVLAAMQILDETLARMRYSTQGRILAELALVRISQLEDLDGLAELIAGLRAGTMELGPAVAGSPGAATAAASKKNDEPGVAPSEALEPPVAARPTFTLLETNATEVWSGVLAGMSGMAVDSAREFERVSLAGPNRLVVTLKPGYALAKSICERPAQLEQFETALAEATGRRVRIEFALHEEKPASDAPVAAAPSATASPPAGPSRQRTMDVVEHPMIRRAADLFGAQPVMSAIRFPDQERPQGQ